MDPFPPKRGYNDTTKDIGRRTAKDTGRRLERIQREG